MATDREIQAHKEWLGFLQPVGLVVSPPALVAAQASVNRNVVELQQRLLANVETVDITSHSLSISDFPTFVVDVLGWEETDLVESPDELDLSLVEYGEVLRPTYAVPHTDNGGWLMLVQVISPGIELDRVSENTKFTGWHANPQSKFERLLREKEIPIGLLCNGIQIRLVYAPRGESSGHLTFPFNWEIEFPEVFDRENPGFDAIVGNPPFAGKNTAINANVSGYMDWLKVVNPEAHGNSDLVAHFFRRAFNLLRESGSFGLIATNTIAQGDTRSTGLRFICENGGIIYNAQKRMKWHGLAAVVVSVIHVFKQQRQGINSPSKNENPLKRIEENIDENSSRFQPTSAMRPEIDFRTGVDANQTNSQNGKYLQPILDGKQVDFISAFLFHAGGSKNPAVLLANADKSFQGSTVLGMGFTFDDSNNDATPIAEMHRLIDENPQNQERIFPYIGGEEVNSSPNHSHHRYVINFGEMSEAEARQYPDLMQIVEEKVKPERLVQKDKGAKEKWWQYTRPRTDLYQAIAPLKRVLVTNAQASTHLCFIFYSPRVVFANSLNIFPFQTYSSFTVVQSRIHEVFARFFSSSMKDDIRYNPSDCFETFPFPENWETNPTLEAIGKEYYEYRAALMLRNNQGLTDTYNRFHDPEENHPDILKLRELHTAMDKAVLDAYGWSDIPTECTFLLDYEEEEDQQAEGSGRQKKKPWRDRWCEEVHDEVLARLLDLNQKRAEMEILRGIGEKTKGKCSELQTSGDKTANKALTETTLTANKVLLKTTLNAF